MTLRETYTKKLVPALQKELEIKNVMEVPGLEKIVVNSGVGAFRDSREALESFVEEVAALTGQKPTLRSARLSEAGFKIRRGDTVGVAVTLRGDRMWAFLEKLINVVLPQVRDFKGVSTKSFDKNGNYSLGLTEHTIFPEVDANKVKAIRGFQITVVTDKNNLEHSKALLEALGMPFRKEEK